MKSLSALVFLPALLFSVVNNNAFGWSWRDLKVGITTEEELLALGGEPEKVIFLAKSYQALKEGKPYFCQFEYRDSEGLRRMVKVGYFYDPSKQAVITSGPLRLSEEIREIRMDAFISEGKLKSFSYLFLFSSNKVDRKKYADIFNTLVGGKPIQFSESGHIIGIKYDDYRLMIDDTGIHFSTIAK